MNVLEKILQEIDKKADYYEMDEQGREHIRMVDMVEVEDIIRSRMDEVSTLEKKPIWEMDIIHHESYDLGRNVGWNECLETMQRYEPLDK